MDDKKIWVGFNLIKDIGAVCMQELESYFGDLESAWKASPAVLAQAGLGLKVIEGIVQARESVNLNKVREKIGKQGMKILTRLDETYPQRLTEIDPPAPGYIFGVNICPTICLRLASSARGFDAIVHQTVLKDGG